MTSGEHVDIRRMPGQKCFLRVMFAFLMTYSLWCSGIVPADLVLVVIMVGLWV